MKVWDPLRPLRRACDAPRGVELTAWLTQTRVQASAENLRRENWSSWRLLAEPMGWTFDRQRPFQPWRHKGGTPFLASWMTA